MLDADVARRFEHVEKSGDVAVGVCVRRLERVADAGLRGEMNDARRALALEQARKGIAIGDVGELETESRRLLEDREPRALERRIVVLVEIVDAEDVVAAREETLRDVKSDEAGRA